MPTINIMIFVNKMKSKLTVSTYIKIKIVKHILLMVY